MATPTPATQHSSYVPVRDDWLGRRSETVLEPGLPIVDPHHHLWDRPGWRYMLDDLLADTNSGHNLVATVFVQCRAFHRASGPADMQPIGETEFANGIAAMSASGLYGKTKICAGIVSHADMLLGAKAEAVLAAHVAAGNGRFRGIRHITAWDADESLMNPAYAPPKGVMADATFREGVKTLGRMGLTFDAWLYHTQIDELTALAKACPGTNIVLDHVGGPLAIGPYAGKRDAIFPAWAAAMKALAACPNVFVKVGGMGMRINGFGFEEKSEPPSSETLTAAWKPYVDTCVSAFGASRCMFESNFPVDKGSYGYPVFWNACKLLAKSASAGEKADLFAGTANRFYKLGLSL